MSEQKTRKHGVGIQHGAYLGGVIDRKTLKDRCRIDGQCWRWGLAIHRGAPRVVARIGDESRVLRGRAGAWAIGNGMFPPPKMIAWGIDECRHTDCVNPDHARLGTKPEFGAWLAASGKVKGIPAKIAANRRNSRAVCKLTDEQAELIRDSESRQMDLAERFGVSQSTISAIKTGLLHKPKTTLNGASVFSWVPQ